MIAEKPRPSFGATLLGPALTQFRLWAPDSASVSVEIVGRDSVPMANIGDGWFEAEIACGAGTHYRYRISSDMTVPDPASRAQAGDVHDASIVVDQNTYDWRFPKWAGRPWHEAVIYELHVGALGGFAGVIDRLPYLAQLGVTAIELMPIAEFPGERSWGYDGVLIYAPAAVYGSPDDLKRLVDTAHGLGLMVLLDVVYNHLGPDGNYVGTYAKEFYRHDRSTPWGDAFDFRRKQVQRFFTENALFWLTEYRFDGLRLDAVHEIGDTDFLAAFAAEVRARVGNSRHIHLTVENEDNDAHLLRLGPGAPGFDAQWADDFHHCLHVMLTGEREAYYLDFFNDPGVLLARCLAEGFAFQGQPSRFAGGESRGTESGYLPSTAFIICLQNHDQIGNRAFGERLDRLSHPGALRAATVLLLLCPQIPLLFMGQEWAATSPFLYFADHTPDLADAVRAGRRQEFAHFAAFADPAQRAQIPDPNDSRTFFDSVPDIGEISHTAHSGWLELHHRLLVVRTTDIMPRMAGVRALGAEPLGKMAVRAHWLMGDGTSLEIAANLGIEPVPCPPPMGRVLYAIEERRDPGMLPLRSVEVTLQETGDAR